MAKGKVKVAYVSYSLQAPGLVCFVWLHHNGADIALSFSFVAILNLR